MGFIFHENIGDFFMSFTGSIKVTTVPSTATAIEPELLEGERLLAVDAPAHQVVGDPHPLADLAKP